MIIFGIMDLELVNSFFQFKIKTPVSLGNSSPGSGGGGATPSAVGAGAANPSILATALTLVPLGLTPIAVFPPYNTPRQIPAISVIFSEDPDIRYKLLLRHQRKTNNVSLL